MFVRFGEFQFNHDTWSLLRRGHLVHLTPKASKLLGMVLASRPHPVAKADLERQLWPDTFVSESSLPNVVLELRRLFDRYGAPPLIVTARGLGYAFVGEAHSGQPPPVPLGLFRALVNGREIGLVEGENWIGRANECRIQVGCSLVSRRHACVVVDGGDAMLKDGGSRNGTFLNHERLTRPVTLHHRDEIRVGSIYLNLRIVHPEKATDAEPLSMMDRAPAKNPWTPRRKV